MKFYNFLYSIVLYVKNSKIKCYGVILTNYDTNSQNLEEKYLPQLIERFTSYETIGFIPQYCNIQDLTPETLISDTLNGIKLDKVFNKKIRIVNSD